ncbi:ornithine cyclodeaminase family protein [Kutzneria sp. CA-103260]|uniref:ornithine cyclodeaminase family protein n=1 Tax=Kutzneria sp. CA-103260 TaxID=2802641 RepID=UPI001BAB7ADC|nr:ornithine cyclodeaminase family protein [Kutzneria sp. CA-103260]QUQ68327.1 ornithine cyclodeaminase family protein [Kutzneria sp. CA-103260]
MTRELRFFSRKDVLRLLDPDTAIRSQRRAFTELAAGKADLPDKIMHASHFDDSVMFCYASRLSLDSGAVAKVGSVNPGNPARGLASVHAMVIAFDPVTGEPVAIMDGTTVTTLRTAAASAVAVDVLATHDADTLGIIGSGVQARAHARAIARVRPLRAIRLWSPSPQRRTVAADDLAHELGITVDAVGSAEEAVTGLSIVVTCTLSLTPVVHGSWLAPGCTVVSVGSFEPSRCEVDEAVISRCTAVVVDDPATAATHAGPIVLALRSGSLHPADLIPLGDVITDRRRARSTADDILFYNSVGLGVQDAAAAWSIVDPGP